MSLDVLAKVQDFSKSISYIQASTQATWHLNFERGHGIWL